MLVWGRDTFILSLLYLKFQNCKLYCQITCDLSQLEVLIFPIISMVSQIIIHNYLQAVWFIVEVFPPRPQVVEDDK